VSGTHDATLPSLSDRGSARTPRRTLQRGTVIGRYVVLRELGAGGMGVVFAAYDPELDRKVALKLLHRHDAESGRASRGHVRLLREAQAMAKLSHPNVASIHDVGEHDGQVFVAMEFIDGATLRAWLRSSGATWREVLATFVHAGRGLAAAHDKGLVHRDFKPDNVMVGADGRVCVLDFGLASSAHRSSAERNVPLAELEGLALSPGDDPGGLAVTRFGEAVGTPAYMAPEQWSGSQTDPRTDQFAFCVALYEGLFGVRPFEGESIVSLAMHVTAGQIRPLPSRARVPGWLRRACLRGLSLHPRDRFESMDALLAALGRGQARARRRWILGGLGVAVAAGVGAQGYRGVLARRADAACVAAGHAILDDLDAGARARIHDGLVATSVGHAEVTAERVMPWLSSYAETWASHRTQVCRWQREPEQHSPAQVARAQWCLQEGRLQFDSLVTELQRADAAMVHAAVSAAAGLPRASPCLDEGVLASRPDPPSAEARDAVQEVRAQLARVGTLVAAGKYPEGLALVEPARADAERIGWPPLTASARRLEANLLEHVGRYDDAEAAGLAAYFDAAKASAWHTAADAALELLSVIGYHQAHHDEGRAWAKHAELAISFAGDPLGLREATRLSGLGVVRYAAGEYPEARAAHEHALTRYESALGPDHPQVAQAARNVGIIDHATGDFEAARRQFERALAIETEALGPDHPRLARSLTNLAAVDLATGQTEAAIERFARSLQIEQQSLGPDHPDVAVSLNNLAAAHAATGEYAKASAMHERALKIWQAKLGPRHPRVARSLTNLGAIEDELGHHARALQLHTEAAAILEESLGRDHPQLGPILGNLAASELALGHPERAVEALERALVIYDAHDGAQEGELTARFALARALAARGGDDARAVTAATQARDAYLAAGDTTSADEVTAWLDARGR
jgi:tetratricopeptide (TPR) repeat protein/predicted Ser/Thr protein kinase